MTFWEQLLGQSFCVQQVDVDGVSTRVLHSGTGEPVIFLHGISGHLESFVPCVAAYGDQYELHLIDMLGHGWTDKVGDALTPDRLARHVISYLDVRGIAKAHIVGLSLGGWVAGWIAAHYPERVLTTTLIAAAGNEAMGQPEVVDMIKASTRTSVMSDDREDTRKRLQSVVFKDENLTEEIIDVRFAVYQMPDFRANIDGLLALTDVDIYQKYALTPEVLAKVQSEVLIVWGEDDKYSGVADADFLTENLAKSKVVQMSGTGHWPPYERPDDFAKLSITFMQNGLSAVSSGRC